MSKIISLTKYGWYAILFAIMGDLLIPFILAPFYRGCSHTSMAISALGNPQSPVRMHFNLIMLLEGLFFLFAVPTIYKMIPQTVIITSGELHFGTFNIYNTVWIFW